MFYINIENGEINGGSEINNSRFWSDIYFQVEVEESVYNSIMATPGKYKYDQQTEKFIENPDYEQEQAIKAKQQRIDEIKAQLTELDQKRIRALCEPSTLTNESNQTWLEYYNNQVLQLREELQSLLGEQ